MEYKLDPDYLEKKNQSLHMILILALMVSVIIAYIISDSMIWFAPFGATMILAIWLRQKHNAQMARVDQYRIIIHDGKLVYRWPEGYSELHQGDILRLDANVNSKQQIQVTLTKTDNQIISLEGFQNMSTLIEHLKQELCPLESNTIAV